MKEMEKQKKPGEKARPPKPAPKPAKKGRPALTGDQVSDMRARIAQTAIRLFRTQGYSAVSMRRLAQELGCAPMTLYTYYDAKIDILRHIWELVFDELFTGLAKTAAARRTPAKRLTALSIAYVEYWLAHPDHYRMVFMSEGVSQPDVSVFIGSTDIVARYGILFNALAETLDLHEQDPALKKKADLLVCLLNGIAHNKITMNGYDWTQTKTLVKTAVEGMKLSA